MNYNIQNKRITLTNGYSLDFEYPIKETLSLDEIIIILVESPFNILYRQNVFAIKSSGDFLWRIDDLELFYTGSDPCFYVGVELNEKNELVLFNWCDTAVIVNPETGKFIRKYQTK